MAGGKALVALLLCVAVSGVLCDFTLDGDVLKLDGKTWEQHVAQSGDIPMVMRTFMKNICHCGVDKRGPTNGISPSQYSMSSCREACIKKFSDQKQKQCASFCASLMPAPKDFYCPIAIPFCCSKFVCKPRGDAEFMPVGWTDPKYANVIKELGVLKRRKLALASVQAATATWNVEACSTSRTKLSEWKIVKRTSGPFIDTFETVPATYQNKFSPAGSCFGRGVLSDSEKKERLAEIERDKSKHLGGDDGNDDPPAAPHGDNKRARDDDDDDLPPGKRSRTGGDQGDDDDDDLPPAPPKKSVPMGHARGGGDENGGELDVDDIADRFVAALRAHFLSAEVKRERKAEGWNIDANLLDGATKDTLLEILAPCDPVDKCVKHEWLIDWKENLPTLTYGDAWHMLSSHEGSIDSDKYRYSDGCIEDID